MDKFTDRRLRPAVLGRLCRTVDLKSTQRIHKNVTPINLLIIQLSALCPEKKDATIFLPRTLPSLLVKEV